ncbi:MAG: phenylalanine--tRNA ligase subunit beta [Bdellovibrionales bacterium RIFCSPHIGHO2_01_FULL_40_29]|nr:MAG: phenylalanine--tRNA ligase subunit beta [Bdellovibrionales bacterium RIFCSPHIGHO2_01_FULL_40_29]OFZ34509.1 MAG: phenylalanine--tRNA ligase subunit beta [Bdellovibrionales bacterium RIFCSPHIGHO2_02_FULL_40_15]
MKISLKWINEFVDISSFLAEPQALADLLTKAGLEVEEIQNKAKDFQNVVVGLVTVKDKHPNADKLSLCQVEIAPGQVAQIVCGAQNHKAGDKVIVALPGAVLPGNFAIKKSKIRDVESLGMLCSYKELGMADTSDGIVILDPTAPVGKNFAEFAGHDDVTFELKVTPNRADCLSHYGLAREIGCLLNKPVKKPEIQKQFVSLSTKNKVSLKIENADLCPRYCGRYIAKVKIGPSPAWLVQKLQSIGQNSINNVVDVTNYVMLEMGQPLHAFDADLLMGNSIVVRTAKKDEKFKTLKEQEIVMTGDELLICDSEKAVALAGVIGGLNSGVSEKTQNIFLESAYFQPMSARKSSRAHGIETDSAYRFSRGVDPSSTFEIMDRAVYLIQQVAGGEAYGDHHDVYPMPVVKNPISISIQTVSDRLGYVADEKLFIQYLQGLQCKIDSAGAGNFKITPPLFRFDLNSDMDLVEEYARLHGYEHLGETIPVLKTEPVAHDFQYMEVQKVSSLFRAQGFSQAFNYAFVNEKEESQFLGSTAVLQKTGLMTDEKSIPLMNPLSEELNGMRRTLSFGLAQNVLSNVHAGNSYGKLFESGGIFFRSGNEYKETLRTSLISWGDPIGVFKTTAPHLFQVKAAVEKLLQAYQINSFTWLQSTDAPAFLHRGQFASLVVEGKNIGFVGSVHPGWLNQKKIRCDVAVAEIDLQQLLVGQPRPRKFKSLSSFQPVERDFAFVMDSGKPVGDLIKEIKKAAGANLKQIHVFDIYEGDKLPHGKKSVALKVELHSFTTPLSESEIQNLSQKVIEGAQKSLGATLRQ